MGDFMENWIFRVRAKEVKNKWRRHTSCYLGFTSVPREAHFVLPFSRKVAFHTNHRRFVTVSLRLVRFQHFTPCSCWVV